ncbi:MAG: hypothetical protein Q8P67_29090 [archaeon]|nr:hypothetical protein [archaeon]
MKGFGAQFKKLTKHSSQPPSEALAKGDKHDNSLILLQVKLTEDIRVYLKEITAGFQRQMKTANAWAEDLKAVALIAETWGNRFSSQSGAHQLAQSLKRVCQFNKMVAASMMTVSKFLEFGIIEPQKKFIAEDIKAAGEIRKKYERAKQEVFSGEEAIEALAKQNKPPGEAELRLACARQTFAEISDEAVSKLTHTTEQADCNSVEICYSYLETHRSFFSKGVEWMGGVAAEFGELKQYVSSQQAELARNAPTAPESYGRLRVFGAGLEDISARDPHHAVPSPLREIIEGLYGHLETDGLFRVSPDQAVLEKPRVLMDTGKTPDLAKTDPHVLTGLLKKFLRSMPDPLLCSRFFSQWVTLPSLEEAQRRQVCSAILAKLPPANLELLKAIVQLCIAIDAHSATNRMNLSNLAIIFAPCVLWEVDSGAHSPKDPRSAALLIADAQKAVEYLFHTLGIDPTFTFSPRSSASASSSSSDSPRRLDSPGSPAHPVLPRLPPANRSALPHTNRPVPPATPPSKPLPPIKGSPTPLGHSSEDYTSGPPGLPQHETSRPLSLRAGQPSPRAPPSPSPSPRGLPTPSPR